jgi:hypothetical protein
MGGQRRPDGKSSEPAVEAEKKIRLPIIPIYMELTGGFSKTPPFGIWLRGKHGCDVLRQA